MKGKILDYSIQESAGVISGDNGERYEFKNTDWKSNKAPAAGQHVDFEAEDKTAKGIYLENISPQIDIDSLKAKFANVQNSEIVGNLLSKKDEILKSGMQNKFGFILAIITLFALFLPAIKIPYGGNLSAIDNGSGKLVFVLLIVLASLYYMGAKHIFIKVLTGIIVTIAFFQFYDLFSELNQGNDMMNTFGGRHNNANFFELLHVGVFVLIPLTALLAYAGFKKKYIEAI